MNKKMKLDLQFFASNESIIEKAVDTSGNYGSSGLLSPADAEGFILMIQDDSSFLNRMDSENVGRLQGTVSKLGVGSRLLRNHTEEEEE